MHLLAMLLQQEQMSPDQAMKFAMAIVPLFGILIIVMLAIVIVPCWFICKKAGFSPWLSLLNLIPVGNLVLLYVLAFAEWKVVPAPLAGLRPPYPPQPPYPPPQA